MFRDHVYISCEMTTKSSPLTKSLSDKESWCAGTTPLQSVSVLQGCVGTIQYSQFELRTPARTAAKQALSQPFHVKNRHVYQTSGRLRRWRQVFGFCQEIAFLLLKEASLP